MFRKLFTKRKKNFSDEFNELLKKEKKEKDEFKIFNLENDTKIRVGETEKNENVFIDLESISSMLVYGSTGSGKSVFINRIITELTLRNNPGNLQLIFIDPKMVEYWGYKHSPFALVDPICDMSESLKTLEYLNDLYDERKKLINSGKNKKDDFKKIVLVVDEYADLLMQYPHSENLLLRLMIDCKDVNIHLIISTQRATNFNLKYIINHFDEKIFMCGMYGDYNHYDKIVSKDEYHLINQIPYFGYFILWSTKEFLYSNYVLNEVLNEYLNSSKEKYLSFTPSDDDFQMLFKQQVSGIITPGIKLSENLVQDVYFNNKTYAAHQEKIRVILEMLNLHDKKFVRTMKELDPSYEYLFLRTKHHGDPSRKLGLNIEIVIYLNENASTYVVRDIFNNHLAKSRQKVTEIKRTGKIAVLKLEDF